MNVPAPGRITRLRDILEIEDYLLLAAVAGLPWAFGGVQVWTFRTAALLIVAAAAVAVFRDGPGALIQRRRLTWLAPAFLLVLWGALQLAPIPPSVLRALSPAADEIYRETFPDYPGAPQMATQIAIEQMALDHVPEVEGLPYPDRLERIPEMEAGGRWSGWRSLSLVPDASVERVLWFVALLIAFLLVRERCRNPEIAETYRLVLFALFFTLAVFGLIYAATSNGKLYWVRETLDSAHPFGPYVNPTNFAGVMELAIPWLAGYTIFAWYAWPRTTPLRETRIPFLIAATALCMLAALATASKGAAALILAALSVLTIVAVRGWRRRLVVLSAVVTLFAVVAPLVLYLPLGERVRDFVESTGGNVSRVDRVVAWRASVEMLGDHPVTGSGFGSFSDVFPAYLPAGEYRRWSHVHNDYLELALEGGAIAIVLMVWLGFGFWRRLASAAIRSRGRPIPNLPFVGLTLGILALSVHAFFDFNHQIPANALLFAVLAGIAIAHSESVERPTV